MKLLGFLLSMLFVLNAQASDIYCENVDEEFPDDTLEFVLQGDTTYAYYWDNDSEHSVECEASAFGGFVCEDSYFTIRLYDSGDAIVEYYGEMTVDFNCP